MTNTRVVITGLGCITPLGLNVEDYWNGLVAGRSGIEPITSFDTDSFPVKVAAEVHGFDPKEFMEAKVARRTGRFVQFAIASTKMAMESAYLDMSKENPDRVGVVIGSIGDHYHASGEVKVIQERGAQRVDPFLITKLSAHTVATQVGRIAGAKGPNTSPNSACASGNDALGIALNYLRLGFADIMLAGGAESIINPLVVALLGRVGAVSKETDPRCACRPFDLNRSGFILGEGAGILVLETYEHARRRNAPILVELAGAGWSFDAYGDVAPDPDGQALAMTAVLKDAGVSPGEIDYVNAHGTSTKLNDAAETKALKSALGHRAFEIPISSNKSMIGHLVAAGGAVETIASVLTIKHGIIPPTINYETPDPDCDLDYVPNKARRVKANTVLCDSFGLGGQNCCLVIRRFEE
jgi:3-oxoacyl-[acyl-carrier-protein] synthase II